MRNYLRHKISLTLLLSSLAIAVLLTLIPLPQVINYFRPNWLLLLVIGWMLIAPYQVGLLAVWLIGIGQDILYNAPLGEHALIFTLIAYLLIKFQARINFFAFGHKILIVLSLIVLVYLLEFWLRNLLGDYVKVWFYWAPIITTLIFWPWVDIFLRHWQGKSTKCSTLI